MCKFRTYTTSPLFFLYFLLIFQKGTVQWLNCTYLKYELNRSYNSGGVVYVLKSELSISSLQYKKSRGGRILNIKSTFGLFALHRHGMDDLKKLLQNPFFKNLVGTENFTSNRIIWSIIIAVISEQNDF